jgi:predicted nucleic acid-binding protein
LATFIDTNILVYALSATSPHFEWSVENLAARRLMGPMYVDAIVFAELSLGFQTVADLSGSLASLGVEILQAQNTGLFLAGRVFKTYKAQGGTKNHVLPDFLIGANAVDRGLPLMTSDIHRYHTYFPTLELIVPSR